MNVRLIDFDARLPQDPTKTFAPDFIKDIPNSAALVSYRVVTTTGTARKDRFYEFVQRSIVSELTARVKIWGTYDRF